MRVEPRVFAHSSLSLVQDEFFCAKKAFYLQALKPLAMVEQVDRAKKEQQPQWITSEAEVGWNRDHIWPSLAILLKGGIYGYDRISCCYS